MAQEKIKVLLKVHADGSVYDVVDADTNEPVEYDTVDKDSAEASVPANVSRTLNSGVFHPREASVFRAYEDECLAFVPMPHVAFDRQLLTGCAYVMSAERVPALDSAFPLELRYASGLTAVEIETHDADTGLTIGEVRRGARTGARALAASPRANPPPHAPTQAYFRTPDFRRLLVSANDVLRKRPRGEPPGVIQREAVEALRAFSSEAFPGDPLLRKWHPDPFAVWEPQLRDGDFMGIYKSNWERVHRKTRATAGHTDGAIHFYAVVGWTLPAEIADQLAHVIKTNPRGGTWAEARTRVACGASAFAGRACARTDAGARARAQIAGRVEFQKAEELARSVRERLLTTFLHVTRLSARSSCPAPVHTVSDVLRRARVSLSSLGVASSPDDVTERDVVIFYAGATSTLDAGPGVLTMTLGDPSRTIAWCAPAAGQNNRPAKISPRPTPWRPQVPRPARDGRRRRPLVERVGRGARVSQRGRASQAWSRAGRLAGRRRRVRVRQERLRQARVRRTGELGAPTRPRGLRLRLLVDAVPKKPQERRVEPVDHLQRQLRGANVASGRNVPRSRACVAAQRARLGQELAHAPHELGVALVAQLAHEVQAQHQARVVAQGADALSRVLRHLHQRFESHLAAAHGQLLDARVRPVQRPRS